MKRLILLIVLIFPLTGLAAQEDFGFGDASDLSSGDSGGFGFGASGGRGSGSGLFVKVSGEVSAELTGFYNDFNSAEELKKTTLGDVFLGKLNFSAGGSAAEAVINFNLRPVFDGTSPIEIDEAFVRAFFGPITVEGGLRKITWGKADSFGPLDIVNPLDYQDLTQLSDPRSVKIARPMIRAAWALGSFTKLEAVFLPTFAGHKFASAGRWTPGVFTGAYDLMASAIENKANVYLGIIYMAHFGETGIAAAIAERGEYIRNEMNLWASSVNPEDLFPNTKTLKYAQGGLRFTTSLGSNDFGFQYYFGRFLRPAISITIDNGFLSPKNPANPYDPNTNPVINTNAISIGDYNYYHQIAADFARVAAGFNIRAEAGFNLTKDLKGTDGAVENPAFVWSLGFDRDLFWGINLNLQGNGRLRLMQNKLGSNPLADCEAGSKISSTRITAIISKKFIRDELELKVSGLWGIEDRDFLIMPSVTWSRNDVSVGASAGFFGGDKNGELGQYKKNSYIRIFLSYEF